MRLRRAAAGHAARGILQLKPRGLGIDGAVVPGLLLLVARDLALYDPPRVVAWRLSHDERLAAASAWLGPLLPAPSGAWDRDPIALVLAALATLLALGYAAMAAAGVRARFRAWTIALAALVLVVLPSAAFVAMGVATERPYGQDGGVVQLPLALDRILAGESPYGADYSGTILARQARVSSFWDELGGNPILRHHAYLPGTHLVMLPFHLASKAAFGFFDPRLVTLLFYGLVVALAARLPSDDETRLAAASVAALNPLVYWHQIFGANDLVFVAMLLAAVLAARSGRSLAAGALLGLACATKQLAWPFAPFLLVAVAGARSFREWTLPSTWRRLAPPLGAAAFVFLLVVLPVALLDFRAFWADVFVYNAGLRGGDNYPLGGTPGFGFANFLIYFGPVSDLRQYFPFSVFYPLLVPLGLLLVRAQMRDGRPEWALATGSAALVASLYFSRVVHPNYLIAAAVCLPLAVLAARRGADLAVAPLLLLGVAVEVVEYGLFRATWEQAVGLVPRASGLALALAPKAAPSLTRDPLGLLIGAVAAGLGVLYLSVAATGLTRRVRYAVAFTAFALVVVAPTLLLAAVSTQTGIVRAQDPAVVQARADAARLAAARSPYSPPPESSPRGREAVSSSFRLDPPAELLPERPMMPPGLPVLSAALRVADVVDPRVVVLGALLALSAILAVRFEGRRRRTLIAVALLSAPFAIGTVLGAPTATSLAAVVGAWAASRAGHHRSAGVLAGLALALDHRALVVVPVLLSDHGREAGAHLRRATAALAVTYLAIVAPVALLDVRAFVGRALPPAVAGPGLGVANMLAYWGAEGWWAGAAMPVTVIVLLATVFWLLTQPWSGLVKAAIACLVAIVLAPAVSANVVAVPVLLLAMAVAERGVERTEERTDDNEIRGRTGTERGQLPDGLD